MTYPRTIQRTLSSALPAGYFATAPREREGAMDWESLADADAEYRAWLEARCDEDRAALSAGDVAAEPWARDAA